MGGVLQVCWYRRSAENVYIGRHFLAMILLAVDDGPAEANTPLSLLCSQYYNSTGDCKCSVTAQYSLMQLPCAVPLLCLQLCFPGLKEVQLRYQDRLQGTRGKCRQRFWPQRPLKTHKNRYLSKTIIVLLALSMTCRQAASCVSQV